MAEVRCWNCEEVIDSTDETTIEYLPWIKANVVVHVYCADPMPEDEGSDPYDTLEEARGER